MEDSEKNTRKPLALVLDDDKSIRDTLEAVLEIRGYEVMTADNGQRALSLMLERKPDVAVFDVIVPGMDGLTLTKKVKRHPDLADVPILIITVITKDSDLADGFWKMGAGADDFVTKPFDPFDLADRVERLHRQFSQAREAVGREA